MKKDWKHGLTQNEISKKQTDEEAWNDLQERINIEEEAIRKGNN